MRIVTRSLFALTILVAAGTFTSAVAQQTGKVEEDVPSLDMTDVPSAAPAADPTRAGASSATTIGLSGSAFDAFRTISPGEPSPEMSEVLRRLDAGETVSFALRFQIGSNGQPTGVVIERGTGIPSVDQALVQEFSRGGAASPARELADFSDMRVAVSVSRKRLSAMFSASARSAERAAEVAEQGRALLVLGKGAFKGDPDAEQIGRAISITNSGSMLSISMDLDLGLVERFARRSKDAIRISSQ